MKYFIDFEFLEGNVPCQTKGFNIPKWLIKPNNTIQPISVGICSSDGREYYAISKDFNLKEAWNRYDLKERKDYANYPKKDIGNILYKKEYWIRDNILKPIFDELYILQYKESCKLGAGVSLLLNGFEKKNNLSPDSTNHVKFTYNNLRTLIDKYGKTDKQIAEDIIKFVGYKEGDKWLRNSKEGNYITEITSEFNKNGISFYGYYCDYDWVVFCWLFGKMIDLPTGFPEFCIDLKQILDEKSTGRINVDKYHIDKKDWILNHENYPKQINEHNALADARFNRDLFNFLNTI